MKLKEFVDKYGDYDIKDEDKLKELLVNKCIKWKPMYGEEYYYIVSGNVTCALWTNSRKDNYNRNFSRIFKTRQEAERYLEIQLACHEAIFEPDWENCNQCKYFFYYDYGAKKVYVSYVYNFTYNIPFCFKSEEIAKSLIDKFGEKDIAKYVLGVEI